jgi:hypothetical protein
VFELQESNSLQPNLVVTGVFFEEDDLTNLDFFLQQWIASYSYNSSLRGSRNVIVF